MNPRRALSCGDGGSHLRGDPVARPGDARRRQRSTTASAVTAIRGTSSTRHSTRSPTLHSPRGQLAQRSTRPSRDGREPARSRTRHEGHGFPRKALDMPKEKLAEDLSTSTRSNARSRAPRRLQGSAGEHEGCLRGGHGRHAEQGLLSGRPVRICYKFYEAYFYNDMQ